MVFISALAAATSGRISVTLPLDLMETQNRSPE